MAKKIKTLLIFAFVLRIIFAFIVWHPDLNNHIDWGIRFFEYGPQKFFAPETNVWSYTWPNQPPGSIYMFAGIRKLFEFLFSFVWLINIKVSIFPSGIVTFFEKTLYEAFLQLPAIIADFGIAYLIYKLIFQIVPKAKKRKEIALAGSLMFLFNPAVWYNSSVWGQYDSVINFFALLSFYLLLNKKLNWSVLAFSMSLYTKASLAIFLPIYAIVAFKKYSLKEIAKSVGISAVVIGLITLPFSRGEPFSWLYNLYTKKVFVQQLHVITANAFNVWAFLTGIHERPDSLMFSVFQYKTWGTLLYVVSYIPVLYLIFKKQDKKTIFWSLSIIAFSTFMLLTNMHERYIYPLFPVFTILAATNKKLRFAYWTISILSLINLWHFWWVPKITPLINIISTGDRMPPRILGLIGFILFLYLYKTFLRLLRPTKI